MNHRGQPVFTDGVWKLLISISFSNCQLHHNTPLPIVLKCFFLGWRGLWYYDIMIKTIDVVSKISSNVTGDKNSVNRVFRHQSGYTTASVLSLNGRISWFWKPLVPFKLLVYVQRYVQHMKHVSYPITRWEGFSEQCLSFADWVCPIGSSDNITL